MWSPDTPGDMTQFDQTSKSYDRPLGGFLSYCPRESTMMTLPNLWRHRPHRSEVYSMTVRETTGVSPTRVSVTRKDP